MARRLLHPRFHRFARQESRGDSIRRFTEGCGSSAESRGAVSLNRHAIVVHPLIGALVTACAEVAERALPPCSEGSCSEAKAYLSRWLMSRRPPVECRLFVGKMPASRRYVDQFL